MKIKGDSPRDLGIHLAIILVDKIDATKVVIVRQKIFPYYLDQKVKLVA